MNPKISFIIATKNREEVIKDTINSMLDQTIENWEAVIVDDHGNDNTEEIVKSYQDDRLRYFYLPNAHGSGVNCARNFAAMQAKAEIVAILDSDDICYPNRVEITIKSFEKDKNAEVFYGNIDNWDERTGEVRDRAKPFTEFDLEILKEYNFISHPTVAMRKDVLQNNPYNPYFRLVEDYELMTRLAVLGKKFVWSSEKILKYRISANNSSIGDDKKELMTCYSDLIHMLRGWRDFDYKVISKINDIEHNK